jgi:putative transposase
LSLIWNESIEKDTDIRKSRLTEEKIISVLAEQERGMGTAEVCCKHGISPGLWEANFGGGAISGSRELKALDMERISGEKSCSPMQCSAMRP